MSVISIVYENRGGAIVSEEFDPNEYTVEIGSGWLLLKRYEGGTFRGQVVEEWWYPPQIVRRVHAGTERSMR